jgi:hypothetical protein
VRVVVAALCARAALFRARRAPELRAEHVQRVPEQSAALQVRY